jgi:hypothetical protein
MQIKKDLKSCQRNIKERIELNKTKVIIYK